MDVFIRDYLMGSSLAYYLIGIVVYGISRTVFVMRRKKSTSIKRELLLFVFASYCIIVVAATVIPKWYLNTIDGVDHIEFNLLHFGQPQFNFIPFKTIFSFITQEGELSKINLLSNLFLLFPFGLLFPVLWPARKKKTVLYGLLISVAIEILQIIPGRSTDIDDVIFNVLGCGAGYIGYRVCRFIAARRTK